MLNPNIESLTKLHGSRDKAMAAYREIADLGGFGTIGDGPGQIHPENRGGLDVAGVLREDNTAISAAAKDRIAKLCGEKRIEEYNTSSSAAKMRQPKKDEEN